MAGSVSWSREEDKAFENAIAMHWIEKDEYEEQWEKIASMVPSKTLEELKQHYDLLVEDITVIESGHASVPCYKGEEASSSAKDHFHGVSTAVAGNSDKRSNSSYGNRFSGLSVDSSGHEGKGSSRSDLQSSIHDITSLNNGDASHQAPITGQQASTNTSDRVAMGQSAKQRAQPHLPSLGMYVAPVGRSISGLGHMGSAVGTPVMLPPTHSPSYIVPIAYPVTPPHMHH